MTRLTVFTAAVLTCLPVFAAERYMGPRPPKADVPYLVHADNLIETEAGTAKNETRKDTTVAVVAGAASPVKTPLSEPIFLIRTDREQASKFEVYALETKNGNRETVIGHTKGKGVARPVHVEVTRLDDNLYRIEVDEPLANGEYTITPQGADTTFSFAIY